MKKLILFSMLALFTIHNSQFTLQAQGVWTKRQTPGPAYDFYQGIPGFTIGNYGYTGLGNPDNLNPFFYIWRFDASINKWTQMSRFPGNDTTVRIAPACFSICNYGYIVTGSTYNGGPCPNECWQYNPNNDTWTKKAYFPGTPRVYATGFAIDTVGYVGFGADECSDFTNDFYAYHPSTDTWVQIASCPGQIRDGAIGFGVNGKGYVGFGQDYACVAPINDWWEYDPVQNNWTQKQTYPGEPLKVPTGFAICNTIYLGIGDSAGTIHIDNRFWSYNTSTNAWVEETSFPGVPTVQGASFAIGDTGYYGFGLDTNNTVQQFYKFYANDSCQIIIDSCPNIYTNINKPDLKNTGISIYPNPFSKYCTIELNRNIQTDFTLLDIEGRRINVNVIKGDDKYIVSRNNLSEGIYILSISFNNTTIYKKLIIIN